MSQTSPAAGLAIAVTERDHAFAPADAPVTLLEYGDFGALSAAWPTPI
jgi:hypothetical protein